MGYHQDPRTGEWIVDDAPEYPSGLIGGQDSSASTAPPIMPPYEPPPPAAPPPPPMPDVAPSGPPIPATAADDAALASIGQPQPELGAPLTPQEEKQLADLGLSGNLSVNGVPSGGTATIGEPQIISPEQAALPGTTPGDQLQAPDLGSPAPPVGAPDQLAGTSPLQLGEPNLPSPTAAGTENPVSLETPSLAPPIMAPPTNLAAPEEPGAPAPDAMAGAPVSGAAVPGAPEVSTTPSATPPAPGPGGPVVPAEDAKGLTQQQIEERQKQQVLEEKDAQAKQAHLNEVAKIKEQAKTDADRIVQRHEAELQSAWQKQKDDQAKYRAMGEKDAWGDNATRNKILAGIAILLGGRKAAYFMIGAANGLEEKKKTELALQAKVMEQDGKSYDQIREHQALEMADFNTRKAAGLDAAVARAEAEMQAQGIPATQIAANQDILKLKAEGLKAEDKAKDLLLKEQEQKAKDELNKRKTESEIALNEARTAHMARGKGTGKGGAGGGGDAMSKFVSGANALQAGDPIPPDLAILGRQAGLKPNQIASEVDKYRGSGNKSEKGEGADVKSINDSFKPIRVEAIGTPRSPGPVAELSKIEEMRKTLANAAASGDTDQIKTAMVKAKEQAGTLMSGGKMTVGQMKIMGELESSIDHLTATFGKWSGNPTEGAGAVRRLTGLIENAGEETAQRVKAIRDRGMEQHLAPGIGVADTPAKKRAFEAANVGTFGTATWKGQPLFDEGKQAAARKDQAAPSAPVNNSAPSQDVIPIKTNSDKALLARARMTKPGDPNYDSAQMWLRAHGQM